MKSALLDALRAVHEHYLAARQRPTVTTPCANCGTDIPPMLGYWDEDRHSIYCDEACLLDQIDRRLT